MENIEFMPLPAIIVFDHQKPFREKVSEASHFQKLLINKKFWEVSEGAGSPTVKNEYQCFPFFTND